MRRVVMAIVALSWGIGAPPATASPDPLPEREGLRGEPFLEWTLEYPGAAGNRFDVEAWADFRHEESGEARRSLMFYTGRGDTWAFRFTGTRAGTWTVETGGPGPLGGRSGRVVVREGAEPLDGFLVGEGRRWLWSGSGREVVPQLVMFKEPGAYVRGGAIDTDRMDADLRELIDETGFTGLHIAGGARKWFGGAGGGTTKEGPDPDPEAFEAFEELLVRAYRRGAASHIWLFGSDGYSDSSGHGAVGGPGTPSYDRLMRYIAARLGPIPGWSIGYGFDVHAWADAATLQAWHDGLKADLGGWEHVVGARADKLDWFKDDGSVDRTPLSEVYWSGDYAGYYHYRVAYAWYARCFDFMEKPHLSEDRFRIRRSSRWERKDYTPEMVRRGLWHSTMAGGVGNIWGNLLPSDDAGGSRPFDNRAEGAIQGVEFVVDLGDQVRAYREFWFDRDRFSYDLIRDNSLAGDEIGGEILPIDGGDPIRVCLRDDALGRFVFYSEDVEAVRMDLGGAASPLPAVAVDTRRPYEELDLGTLAPGEIRWRAPRRSDWAVAVGRFPGRGSARDRDDEGEADDAPAEGGPGSRRPSRPRRLPVRRGRRRPPAVVDAVSPGIGRRWARPIGGATRETGRSGAGEHRGDDDRVPLDPAPGPPGPGRRAATGAGESAARQPRWRCPTTSAAGRSPSPPPRSGARSGPPSRGPEGFLHD